MEITMNTRTIKSGLYLVIDPTMEEQALLNKLQLGLTKGLAAVQIWDNFKNVSNVEGLIQKISALCTVHKTPVLINNRWEYLKSLNLDGVHFDQRPHNLDSIVSEIPRSFLVGLTCGNNLDEVRWAANNRVDYISFCSMFPSSSAGDCEIVSHETVEKAREIFDKLLFLAGGIDLETIDKLEKLKYDGIAVISGIMNAENPEKAIAGYHKYLK